MVAEALAKELLVDLAGAGVRDLIDSENVIRETP